VSATNPLPSRLLLVTDRHQAAAPLDEIVSEAVAAGARWIWLRDRDLPPVERHALARRLIALARPRGARLTVGGDIALAAEAVADGVHLSAEGFGACPDRATGDHPASSAGQAFAGTRAAPIAAARARLGARALIGVSAHSEADVAAVAAAGADYATLSPIFASVSKPGYGPALGVAAIARAAPHGLPVLALGGVTAERAGECLRAGAAGIAVMGEVMRAGPAGVRDVVRRYAAALGAIAG
jgi:thiamine-phosphate pyrophosphorylase